MLLTAIIFIPLLGALAMLALPKHDRLFARIIPLVATFASLVLSGFMFLAFNGAEAGYGGYKFVTQIPWVESLGISYTVGVDGINLGLILMGSIVAFAAACVSWEIHEREKEFYILLLLMTGGILGAFASLDLFFLYFFHELALVPTFIMIGVWGRGQDKNYATFQITMYLSLGALIALAGLILLYLSAPVRTFDLVMLTDAVRATPINAHMQGIIFPLLMFGFGILVSLWPFHTWAPLGYGSAPTATAMLHAGVLKKFGLYGLIRVALPLLPDGLNSPVVSQSTFAHFPLSWCPYLFQEILMGMGWLDLLAFLCLGNIFYCGLVAIRQKDLNLLIGNSSVAHMGFVFLGIASLSLVGITGAVMVMIAHGLLAALSFGLSGYIYQQTNTLEISRLGGLLRQMPFVGAALVMAMLAGCGLPGFANFVGEAMVFFGAWEEPTLRFVVVMALWSALVIGAVYMMRGVRNVLHGPAKVEWAGVVDANDAWRRLPFALLLASLFLFGFFPRLLTDKIKVSAEPIVNMAHSVKPSGAKDRLPARTADAR